MKLVQVFLPLYDNNKQVFSRSVYDELGNILKEEFGGVSLYRNASIEGLWKDETGKTNYDELIIAEIMTEEINKVWWNRFRQRLEQIFMQQEILIRYLVFEKL